jgi:GNAT superfamily N-acetyltransferase
LGTRPFDGSLADAQGIIEVDKSTFGGCAYTAEYICALESDPDRCVWIAEQDERVVGFVSAFPTHSLAASRWEVDELAVRPEAQGQGLGGELVMRAVGAGRRHAGLTVARALVAARNLASQRSFTKNGFAPVASMDLLLYRVSGRVPRPPQGGLPVVRDAQPDDVDAIARLGGGASDRVEWLISRSGNLYCIAGGDAGSGCMELVPVRTLQYRGYWIESLAVAGSRSVAMALFNAAVERAKSDDTIDEVGCLVSTTDSVLRAASVGEGFRAMGEYVSMVLELGTP